MPRKKTCFGANFTNFFCRNFSKLFLEEGRENEKKADCGLFFATILQGSLFSKRSSRFFPRHLVCEQSYSKKAGNRFFFSPASFEKSRGTAPLRSRSCCRTWISATRTTPCSSTCSTRTGAVTSRSTRSSRASYRFLFFRRGLG